MEKSIYDIGLKISAIVGSFLQVRSAPSVVRAASFGLAAGGLCAISTAAMAQSGGMGLRIYAAEVSERTSVVVDIVSYTCYIGGCVLSALGVIDLKKHVEQPAQNPLKNGLSKLGFGGMLLAIPFLSGIMIDTMGSDEQQAQYNGFDRSSMRIY